LDKEVSDKEVPSTAEKDAPPVVEEDVPSAATPDDPPMRPRIEVRIPRRTREELERGLVECLPPPDADTFTVSLPPVASDVPDPCTLDWRNVDFTKSRRAELNGLLEKQVFEVVPKEAAQGKRIYGSRFVDEIKHQGTVDAREKSRLVVQGYNDRDHGLLTHAPTVQRASQRLAIAMSVVYGLPAGFSIWIRDVTQAYVQSDTPIARDIYIRAPKELGIADGFLLKVLRPLYGIPEAAIHWWRTYSNHHKDKLGMRDTAYDLCLLHTEGVFEKKKRRSDAAQGITCMQTDDTLNCGNKAFEELEDAEARFLTKGREFLNENSALRFNGATISRSKGCIRISQPEQVARVRTVIAGREESLEEYISQRARGAYIASTCRPDLSFAFAAAAQHRSPGPPEFKALNNALQTIIDTPEEGIQFVPQDPDTLRLAVFIDASFANNPDSSSQLGIVITLMDGDGTTNIIHWTSAKCKRVVRSVLAAELYAMAHGFDLAIAMKAAIDDMLERPMPLAMYTDSKSLYDSLVSLNTVTEKRLLIDLRVLRESYERRELADVFWIPAEQNPADGLTKPPSKSNGALNRLIATNRLELTPNAWVDRDDNTPRIAPRQPPQQPS